MVADKWYSPDEIAELIANGRRALAGEDIDPVPPALLFAPDGKARWMITELHPDFGDMGYGLCDLGIGLPEMGEVDLAQLDGPNGAFMMAAERDGRYRPSPDLPVSRLDRMAAEAGRIVV